jgi:hypothetical protein
MRVLWACSFWIHGLVLGGVYGVVLLGGVGYGCFTDLFRSVWLLPCVGGVSMERMGASELLPVDAGSARSFRRWYPWGIENLAT